MAKIKQIGWLFVLLGVALLATTAFAETVLIVTDPWPPYTIGEAGSEAAGGIFTEAAKAAFAKIGVEAKVMLYPFKRALAMAEEGEADFVLGVSWTEERDKVYSFVKAPIAVDQVKIYYNPEAVAEPKEIKDMANATVSMAAGYNYGDVWNKAVQEQGIKIDESPNDLSGMKKVALGRMPYHVCYAESCRAEIAAKSDPAIGVLKEAAFVISDREFFIAASRKSQKAMDLLPKLEEALRK